MASSKDSFGNYGQVGQDDEPALSASLVAPSPEEVAAPASAVPMMEIVAPATLMEGYQLDTQVGGEGGQVLTITIPLGGVEKGQTFSVPLTPQTGQTTFGGSTTTSTTLSDILHKKMHVPVGHWKDGFADCCQYGLCHASVCVSCWCHALAAGQVIARLQLNWLGRPTHSQSEKGSAFTTLFTISMAYFALKIALFLTIVTLLPEDESKPPPDVVGPLALLGDIINYSYYMFSVVVIWNLRSYVRSKYAIPEEFGCPTGWEDGCCACFCPCMSAAQLMRHTTEYETYRAECCSETGLPKHVPALIV